VKIISLFQTQTLTHTAAFPRSVYLDSVSATLHTPCASHHMCRVRLAVAAVDAERHETAYIRSVQAMCRVSDQIVT